MDELDDLFNEVNTNTEEKKPTNSGGYNNYNKNNNFKKSQYTNVIGKMSINVWNKDKIDPIELETDTLKPDSNFVTFTIANKTYQLDETDRKKLAIVTKLLSEKNYKARIVCSHAKAIYQDLKDSFGDKILHLTPWKGYCKDMKDTTQYLVTDANLQAAAFYFKNFSKLPPNVQLIKAANLASLVGLDNNELSSFIIIFDKHYDGKMIDFEKSRDTTDIYLLKKLLPLNIFNIAKDNEFKDLINLLK